MRMIWVVWRRHRRTTWGFKTLVSGIGTSSAMPGTSIETRIISWRTAIATWMRSRRSRWHWLWLLGPVSAFVKFVRCFI